MAPIDDDSGFSPQYYLTAKDSSLQCNHSRKESGILFSLKVLHIQSQTKCLTLIKEGSVGNHLIIFAASRTFGVLQTHNSYYCCIVQGDYYFSSSRYEIESPPLLLNHSMRECFFLAISAYSSSVYDSLRGLPRR